MLTGDEDYQLCCLLDKMNRPMKPAAIAKRAGGKDSVHTAARRFLDLTKSSVPGYVSPSESVKGAKAAHEELGHHLDDLDKVDWEGHEPRGSDLMPRNPSTDAMAPAKAIITRDWLLRLWVR
jgi:hypothetical protein